MFNFLKLNLDCVYHNSKLQIEDLFEDTRREKIGIIQSLKDNVSHMLEWQNLTSNQEDVVREIEDYCNSVRDRFEYFIVLGVGGSALGAKVIFNSLCSSVHNMLSKEERKAPKFFVLDNIDPVEIDEYLSVIEPEKTLINVVSKSGTTTETMMHFLTFYEKIKKCVGEKNVNEHFVFITDKKQGILHELEISENIKSFYIPAGVGGRFSVLSPVGLLPACMLGLDINKLIDGARQMQIRCQSEKDNPAFDKAVLEYILNKKGVNIVVTIPYSSKLKEFSYWYAQILAESIAKEIDRNGNKINCGLTPVSALGATDQHSQLQLYMEGPEDKLIVCVKVNQFSKNLQCSSDAFNLKELQHLKNVEFGKLINAERKSTLCGLANRGVPYIEIEIEKIDEFALGQLFMLSMYEIAYLGELYNVDAYNQPGVEFGKKVTLAALGVDKYKDYLNACSFVSD